VQEYAGSLDIVPVRLGRQGIAKQIFLGAREGDGDIDYLESFIELARGARLSSGRVASRDALSPA